MKGRIVKGIAGFYYVNSKERVYECKAKGLFRNNNIKPDIIIVEIPDISYLLHIIEESRKEYNLGVAICS